MKIESYAVNSSAQTSYQRVQHQNVDATLWNSSGVRSLQMDYSGVEVSLSDAAKSMLEDAQQSKQGVSPGNARAKAAAAGSVQSTPRLPQNVAELKMQVLEQMLYHLTGKRFASRIVELMQGGGARNSPLAGMAGIAGRAQQAGGRISATSFEYERETMAYQAQGVIQTADGKSISVDVSLAMSREFMAYSSTSIEFGAAQRPAIDPLVINYAGTAASLTNEKFAFDLDVDGQLDNISFAGAGSGFLALDKNGDGIINNGSELFGPNTGNGFDELRSHDSDGNGWIDENDEVFSKLVVWSKDAYGNDQLFRLKDLDIGAIYLGDVQTQFSLNDSANSTQGIMRSTSFFLKESGGAGTISHIDLVV